MRADQDRGQRCASCAFSAPLSATWVYITGAVLECHRYPPTVAVTDAIGQGADRSMVRPQVEAEQWCGEYQPGGRV